MQSYCLTLIQACLKTAVSIGTVFPNKFYMGKYVINNWLCPEGTAKHPKKMLEKGKENAMRNACNVGKFGKVHIFFLSGILFKFRR